MVDLQPSVNLYGPATVSFVVDPLLFVKSRVQAVDPFSFPSLPINGNLWLSLTDMILLNGR